MVERLGEKEFKCRRGKSEESMEKSIEGSKDAVALLLVKDLVINEEGERE